MKLPRYEPMLPVEQGVRDDARFSHEIKWDGFRALAYHEDGRVRLESRGGFSLNERFPLILEAVKLLDDPVVLDGEIVAFNKRGRPDFSLLQRNTEQRGALRYVVFDLLHLADRSLCSLPWFERRLLLEKCCAGRGAIIVSPLLSGDASSNMKFAQEHSLEGIVSKQRNSPYQPGKRSPFWRKQKIKHTLECIVIGIRMGVGGKGIRSLSAGLFAGEGLLIYVGNVGSGLGKSDLEFLQQAIALLAAPHCPAINPPAADNNYIWFKPHLVAEIEYSELTGSIKLRHPVFVRFRFDKKAQQCSLGVDQN